jgi:hypothetical protein
VSGLLYDTDEDVGCYLYIFICFSFVLRSTLLRTTFWYVSQFVCEVCSLGAGCRTMTDVLMVTIIEVWSEVYCRNSIGYEDPVFYWCPWASISESRLISRSSFLSGVTWKVL